MTHQKNKFMHIGAEVILSVIVAPLVWWIVSSIFNLQATAGLDQASIGEIKILIEKQGTKIDHITDLLIEKKGE